MIDDQYSNYQIHGHMLRQRYHSLGSKNFLFCHCWMLEGNTGLPSLIEPLWHHHVMKQSICSLKSLKKVPGLNELHNICKVQGLLELYAILISSKDSVCILELKMLQWPYIHVIKL